MKLTNSSRSFALGLLHLFLNGTALHGRSVPPAISLLPLSFPLCVTSSHFISIPLSPPLPNQGLGRGGGIMCAGVLICHMGPWSCNQNSFWANLCAPFEHAQSYTHRLPGLLGHPLPHFTPRHNQ